ncbi:MAG: 4Fe-4S dicluster domain-containing protein [Candidatus Marinimicrobia bacterium]|nr:4Fe-4S dicluster domain-containing protein [Candidatus Neomarinimicrobiota bacterium]
MPLTIPNQPVLIITLILGITICFGWIAFALISSSENERIAFRRSLLMAIIMACPYLIIGQVSFKYQILCAQILLTITILALIVLILPLGRKIYKPTAVPDNYRIDERDTMFSRSELQPETPRFVEYYHTHPKEKISDDRFRQKPGLLSPQSQYYDPYYFNAADAGFNTIECMRDRVEGTINPEKISVIPAEISRFLKQWVLQLGAHSIGIVRLKPYHLYSVSGRGERYGKPVDLDHSFAIAITVEMDFDSVGTAPLAPTVAESARQYVNSGVIAVQMAKFIRELGYSARAHIDGNYLLVCSLLARDAGLGEIGRMGLLMTPDLGPRIRIAAVTTDLLLIPDKYIPGYTVEDFCRHCKKCAVNCPAGAIPEDDPKNHNGINRWKISDAACYSYWCVVGTDCGQCMRVCPYSHPNTFFHNVIRTGIRNSFVFRRIALMMDDFLYGRTPKPKDLNYPAIDG